MPTRVFSIAFAVRLNAVTSVVSLRNGSLTVSRLRKSLKSISKMRSVLRRPIGHMPIADRQSNAADDEHEERRCADDERDDLHPVVAPPRIRRCQNVQMADRTMTDEHKAAIAAGRIESAAVRDYLDALESNRPKRGHRASPESLAARRADIDTQLAAGDLKPIKRLELLQYGRDIDKQLEALQAEPDMSAVEQGFITHAANFGNRRGIQYATWREAGVPAELLARAGINLLAAHARRLVNDGATHLIIESGDATSDQRDRETLLDTFAGSGVPFQYDWRSKDQPLLWIADAVCGIASEHLLSGDNEIFDRLANAGIIEVANG